MKIRELTESDVTFTVSYEPEESEVRGHFDSGDPELDRQDEQAILKRLSRGDDRAWCTVVVTASWNGWTAKDYLGACTLGGEYTAEVCAADHGMKAEALRRLNRAIADNAAKLAQLVVSEDPPADTRSMRDLANEVIRIQNACNVSGLAYAFPGVLSRLRTLLTEKYGAGPSTSDINEHPITRAWVDKLASLAGVQAWGGTGHDRAKKAHGDCLDLAQDYRFNAGTDTTK